MTGRTRSSRMWATLLALLTGLAGLVVPAAVAHAAPAPHYCWVYEDNPTPPPGYVPNLARQNCNATVDSYTAPNQYVVHMRGVGAPGGVVHVTSVTNPGNGDWCQATAWAQVGLDEFVDVACFAPGGAPAPSAFSVIFTEVDPGYVVAAPRAYAYVYSSSLGAILTSWSSGGAPVVVHAGVGVYNVTLPIGGGASPTGDLQVTAVEGAALGRHCKVATWNTAAAGQTLTVICSNGAAAPALVNTAWTLTYQDETDMAARPAANFGYVALIGNGLPPLANFNSKLGIGANGVAGGYTITFPNVGLEPDNVQVTAYDGSPDYCHLAVLAFPWVIAGANAVVPRLECDTPVGGPVADQFFVSYVGAV